MYYKELDHRSTPLRTLCTTATNAISELVQFSKVGILDGLSAAEYAEYFYGAVLVACQTYALGTVGDINEMRALRGLGKLKKIELYKNDRVSGLQHTFVELINSLANLFKHNQEWDSWPENETTKVLKYFGIDSKTKFPLNAGIGIVIGDSKDLRGLCQALESWRASLVYALEKNA